MQEYLFRTSHRPRPLPSGRWLMTQRWNDLLFAHWPVPAQQISALLPEGLQADTFQGSAWLGVVPRQNSSGGKDRLGGITKTGDHSIRRLLVLGATSVIRRARTRAPGDAEWLKALLARKPARLVTVALANKMARIAWAVLARGEVYRATVPLPAAG